MSEKMEVSKSVLQKRREAIIKEHKRLIKKLRDPVFRARAADFAAKEVREHYSGNIDLVIGGRRLKFYLTLAKLLGENTRFKTLRANLRLDQGQSILHVQEIAFSRSCLEEVRGKIISRKHAPTSRQLVPVAISIVTSQCAIEIEGGPVISLNNGCPCCKTAKGGRQQLHC
jgi:hypothetical protein